MTHRSQRPERTVLVALLLAAGCASPEPGTAGAVTGALGTPSVVVDDFSSGVSAADHPPAAPFSGTWYDATFNTFGTPSASTLEGRAAMRIDDGGFANGVYAIYSGAIPTTGTYRLSARVHVVEAPSATNGIRAFQLGAAVGAGAVHRGPGSSLLPGVPISASYVGLTTGDDTALGPQTLVTAEFTANAGDDLLVALGTDVTSGTWALGSGTWGGSYVLVGPIELLGSDGSVVVDDDEGAPRFTESAPWTVSSGIGYSGGHYRFASTGAARSATWELAADAGAYEVQAFYVAGTNRASAARYVVETPDGGFERNVDQRTRDRRWVRLGRVSLAAPGAVRVTLSATDSAPAGRVVIADAVRIVPTEPTPVDPPEMRLAAITVFDGLSDVDSIASIVDDLVDHHYNAVAVHTRFRGDATYVPNRADSTYPNREPRNASVGGVDVLDAFVRLGHARGLRVFAYVNTHLVTEGAASPSSPDHVVNAHPEWRTYAYNGGSPVVQTTAEDGEGLWLEPALPAVRDYLADIVGDIARNYEIDGVILDRIRYPQTAFTRANRDFGYHPAAIERFNREQRIRPLSRVPSPSDPAWIAFRQRAITESVAAIHDRMRAIDPSMILLAYPIGRLQDALTFNYQDWPTWMSEGHIDGVLPQIYALDDASFATRLAEHAARYGGDRLFGVTLNAFQPGVNVAHQIETVRAYGLDGTSPFRHGVMSDLGYLDDLDAGWDGVAAWPDTPWTTQPVRALSLDASCGGASPAWTVHNPNPWAIEVTWTVDVTTRGTYWAPPGDSTFSGGTRKVINVAKLFWEDEARRTRFTVSTNVRCLLSR